MGNYGIRISIPGEDVKSCSDLDTVVNSKYANLKGSLSGGGTKSIPFNTVVTETIAHGLGYTPFVSAFIDIAQSGAFVTMPTYLISGVDQQTYWVKADSTNVYIKFWQGNDFGDTYTVDYKYFIYTDKGKV
jgi:hypothetical protein